MRKINKHDIVLYSNLCWKVLHCVLQEKSNQT